MTIDGRRITLWLGWLLAGLLVGLLIRDLQGARATGRPLVDFGALFGQQAQEITQLRNEVERLRQQNENLLRETLSGELSTQRIQKELTDAKNLAGILPVVGPGVVVTLSDARTDDSDDLGVIERGMIHDYDLLYILNELRASGAEAISLESGQLKERVVNFSSVRCVGPTVVINNQKLTAPFEIKAIGDPNVLEAALNMRGGILEQLRRYGLIVTIEKDWNLELPGYSLPIHYEYLRSSTAAEEGEPFSPEDDGTNEAVPVAPGGARTQ